MRCALALLIILAACSSDPASGSGNGGADASPTVPGQSDANPSSPGTGDAGSPGQADASPPPSFGVVVFHQGLEDYVGTRDTELRESQPNSNQGESPLFRWNDGASGATYGLVRFEDLFGPGKVQVPANAEIVSATLTVVVANGNGGPAGTIYRNTVAWDEGLVTWNGFGSSPGVQPEELGPVVGDAPIAEGSRDIDVTSTIAAWIAAPSSNHGWIIAPGEGSGIQASSSESPTSENRPTLTVEWRIPED